MKKSLFIISILVSATGILCRETQAVSTYKDLDASMLDLRIYQENLGDRIRARDMDYASWLLEGMDSILVQLGYQYKEHRKLNSPFSKYYKKLMRGPIAGIRSSIREQDAKSALINYQLLVKNCNECHLDLDINKKVWE